MYGQNIIQRKRYKPEAGFGIFQFQKQGLMRQLLTGKKRIV